MSINKQGQLNSQNLIETTILLNNKNSFQYTPANMDNSTASLTQAIIDFSNLTILQKSIQCHIECDFIWGDFSSGTGQGGTFALYFQGANRKIENDSFIWQGTNYICSALNNKKSCISCINDNNTGGIYHYDTYVTIPASWLAIYNASYLGFRTNYSNGIGIIKIDNIKITLGTTITNQAHIAENYISATEFYEY